MKPHGIGTYLCWPPHTESNSPAMSSRAAAVLVVVLCAAFTGVRASECANVSLTFCDNVNWAVDAEKRARADNIESMIQMR